MNPLEEARARLGNRYEVMVLEPAPPAVRVEPFTDDPTARVEVPHGRTLVAPIETGVAGDLTWDALARDDADLASWCAARALGSWLPPPPLPPTDTFVRTRLSMHALAEHVLCPARHRVNGKIGLRFTRHGFGTPFFGADEQVRIEGTTLVHTASTPADETRTDLTTLGAAASAVGIEARRARPVPADDSARPRSAVRPRRRGRRRARLVVRVRRGGARPVARRRGIERLGEPPSLIQLWPEHFDLAVDLGDTAAGRRANFGASPGDAVHPEPYLYVGPWDLSRLPDPPDPYWNEPFGASLPYSALSGPSGARDAALAFFRAGRARLGA